MPPHTIEFIWVIWPICFAKFESVVCGCVFAILFDLIFNTNAAELQFVTNEIKIARAFKNILLISSVDV